MKVPELQPWEWRQVGYMGISAAVLGGLGWLIFALLFGGCATGETYPVTNGVPNLVQVEPGVWAGGQPRSPAAWSYLRSRGLTNDLKLNVDVEASDQAALDAGFSLHYFPIDTMQQLVTGPDPAAMGAALTWVAPGTFVHCEHGQDRTWYLMGLHLVQEGTNAADAWCMMTNHGYHRALLGLTRSWEETVERMPRR